MGYLSEDDLFNTPLGKAWNLFGDFLGILKLLLVTELKKVSVKDSSNGLVSFECFVIF